MGGGGYSFADACLSHLTVDHASLSRRSTVPTPNKDTSNIWGLTTPFPYTRYYIKLVAYPIPVLIRCLWPRTIICGEGYD